MKPNIQTGTLQVYGKGWRKRQSGATLIEILVTMLLVAFGLLGIAGLQLASVKYQQTSLSRALATSHIQSIAERMRANISVLGGTDTSAYVAADGYAAALASVAGTSPPLAEPSCYTGGTVCTPGESALHDLIEWRKNLAKELPGGAGSLATVTSGTDTVAGVRQVIIMWNEKPSDSDDNLGSLPTDPNCPTPRVAGVRCYSMMVSP